MKTVVITGSSKGFGLSQAKKFRESGWNVVLSSTNGKNLEKALAEMDAIKADGARTIKVVCNVASESDIQNLWDTAKKEFGSIDIWINNAGVNNPDKPVCEMTAEEISYILDIDLKGTILGSKIAFKGMKDQGYGQIYNTEGYGSNDAAMTGLSIYGTSKRATTYFTRALAKESRDLTGDAVKVCRLTPGIMITDFLTNANGGKTKIELPEKVKKVYNILGDYPETIANYCVPKMIANEKNDANVVWLTTARASGRFMTAAFNKNDYFGDKTAKKD